MLAHATHLHPPASGRVERSEGRATVTNATRTLPEASSLGFDPPKGRVKVGLVKEV